MTKLKLVRLEWEDGKMREISGSNFELKADLVLLAMGFVSPDRQGLLEQLGVELECERSVRQLRQ